MFKRVLEIFEAKGEPHVEDVALALNSLGRCARHAGRLGEAEALFRRALEIKKRLSWRPTISSCRDEIRGGAACRRRGWIGGDGIAMHSRFSLFFGPWW